MNTTTNAPEKLFFVVPSNAQMRKKWIQVMKRVDPFGAKSCVYCCEDHFDVIVPHKFECQQQKEDKPKRSAVQKRNRIKLVEKLLAKDAIPSASNAPEEVYVVCCEDERVVEDPLASGNNDLYLEKFKHHKAVQVRLKDKAVHKATITEEKYFKKEKKILNKKSSPNDAVRVRSFCDASSISSTNKTYNLDQNSKSSESDNAEYDKLHFRNHMQKTSLLCISREPQLLLGLSKQCYFCINLLSETTNCTSRNIMITLKKLRLHQPNAILALDFGLATSSVATIIRRTVPAIASAMKSLVFFPPSADVLLNLPIPFRKSCFQVQSIIDCFEIQIEKPVDSVKQALTWSDYKACNTIKYLISITPDGLINFISEGYGGRATDTLIFEDCGILQALPQRAAVLTDRGFKNIAHVLQQHGHTLIRPPSVSAQVQPTKKEVLETKKIAALRINVERAIGRLRSFGFMLPHACVDLKQVDLLDSVVITACGMVYLQSCLFNLE
ncbi:hypothetical protein RN001_009946 [Aquatica leii]|uniref:THAP-type domain-containing protein n=1 Tax=Aquatica leii TaxID=1421715 RepID=A0AAN7SQ46_9COLE|nr:hypothetical protein RN001_009946 [Aquatica leii]